MRIPEVPLIATPQTDDARRAVGFRWAAPEVGKRHKVGGSPDWLQEPQVPGLLQKGNELGFNFVSGQRPTPNKKGHIATTLEWARKLTAEDIQLLKGEAPFGEKVPDPDEGFTAADLKDSKKAEAVYKVIRERLEPYELGLDEPHLDAAIDMVVRVVLSHVMQPSGTPAATANDIAWVAARVLAR